MLCGSFDASAVCLQELMLGWRNTPNLPEFYVIHTVPSDGSLHDGTAIWVRETVARSAVILNSALKAVAARLYLGQRVFTVCSVYFPHGQNFTATDFCVLFSELLH